MCACLEASRRPDRAGSERRQSGTQAAPDQNDDSSAWRAPRVRLRNYAGAFSCFFKGSDAPQLESEEDSGVSGGVASHGMSFWGVVSGRPGVWSAGFSHENRRLGSRIGSVAKPGARKTEYRRTPSKERSFSSEFSIEPYWPWPLCRATCSTLSCA